MGNVVMEFGDAYYELEIDHFEPPGQYRWNEPPENGEINLGHVVTVVKGDEGLFSARPKEKMSMDDFIKVYAEHRDIDYKDAVDALTDECFDIMMQQLSDGYDDDDERIGDGR